MGRLPRSSIACLLLLTIASWFGACTPSAEREQIDRESIQAMLGEYLPYLGRAYSEQNANLIRPWAVDKEIARVHLRIQELSAQGLVLDPVFKTIVVEEANIWNNSNAFVNTVETWDVTRLAQGTRHPLGQEADQVERVKYQLKREGEEWRVLYRTIGG